MHAIAIPNPSAPTDVHSLSQAWLPRQDVAIPVGGGLNAVRICQVWID